MSPTDDARRAADIVAAETPELAERVTERHLAAHPELLQRYGPAGRGRCRADTVRHLEYLVTALRTGVHDVFTEYVEWAATVLAELGIPDTDLDAHLATVSEVLAERLDGASAVAVDTIAAARGRHGTAHPPESFITGPRTELANQFLAAALAGDRVASVQLVTAAVDAGTDLESLYVDVLQPVLREVGRLWQLNRITVAQEHVVTAVTQLAMSTLYPRIFADRRPPTARLLAACVGGELHEVGLRMIADIFELRSWDTHFLGANVPLGSIVDAVERQQPDVVALSVTLAPHVDVVASLIPAIREVAAVPILVGGRPFLTSAELVGHVGADGTAADARAAVARAEELIA